MERSTRETSRQTVGTVLDLPTLPGLTYATHVRAAPRFRLVDASGDDRDFLRNY